jgi:hypothetical protein
MSKIVWLLCLVCVLPSCFAKVIHEQTQFSAEDSTVRRPVKLSASALKALMTDSFVRDAHSESGLGVQEFVDSNLSASEVRLGGPQKKDLVVVAVGRLRGANVTSFWVLRPVRDGYEIVLSGPAHDLHIRRARSHGYRDIDLISATAATISEVHLRFNGSRYIPAL